MVFEFEMCIRVGNRVWKVCAWTNVGVRCENVSVETLLNWNCCSFCEHMSSWAFASHYLALIHRACDVCVCVWCVSIGKVPPLILEPKVRREGGSEMILRAIGGLPYGE